MRYFISILVVALTLNGLLVFAQNKETPPYMEMRKPNYLKVQKKAERYFKKKALKSNNEKDTLTKEMDDAFIVGGHKEDNEYQRYKRWEWFWGKYSYADGSFPDAMKNYEKFKNETKKSKLKSGVATGPDWNFEGPITNTGGYWGMGRCRSISIASDGQTYYVGSAGGGVWKTTDQGSNYTGVGDHLPSLGVTRVRVSQDNPDIAYCIIKETDNYFNSPSLGLYKTIDGGTNWIETWINSTNIDGLKVNYVEINPSNTDVIIVTTNVGIYRSTDAGVNFDLVKSGDFFQVLYHPTNPQIVYANSTDMYKSIDGGVNWVKKTSYGAANSSKMRLAVSDADPDRLYVGVNGELYMSTDKGDSFTKTGTYYHSQMFYVSNYNADWVYSGWLILQQSKDKGASWHDIMKWYWEAGNPLTEVHADFWEGCSDPNNKSLVYFTNDGGVDSYNELTEVWTQHSNGLGIRQLYELGVSQQDYNIMVLGSQDNGGSRKEADGTWIHTQGGDCNMALINPLDDKIMYTQYTNGNDIRRSTDGWQTSTNITSQIDNAGAGSESSSWQTPFYIHDANPDILVCGYESVYITKDAGDSWSKISDKFINIVDEIAISPSDPNVIYAAAYADIHKTFDQGATWVRKTLPVWARPSDIKVHPTDPYTVYVTVGDVKAGTIFKSTDGGENWVDISAGLPDGIVAACIEIEKDSNEGLYVGTSIGVYYKNADMTQFEYYGKGLPNTYIIDLDISYANGGKLFTGTHGRGVWSVDLYSPNDCNGDFEGTAYLDSCDVCVEGNTGKTACVQDCYGDWGGTAYEDECGYCIGGNTGRTDCKDCVDLAADAGNISGLVRTCADVEVYSIELVTNATTYEWTVPDGAVILNGQGTTSITVDFANAESGKIEVAPSNTCSYGASSSIDVTVDTPISAINLGSDIELCSPSSATLDAGLYNGATYTWTKDGEVIGSEQTLIVTNAGTYEVVVEKEETTCDAVSDVIEITSEALPLSINDTICNAGTVDLSVEGDGSYSWYDAAEGGNQLTNGTSYSTDITETTPFYVEDNGTFESYVGPEANSNPLTNMVSMGKQGIYITVYKPCIISEVTIIPYVYDMNDITFTLDLKTSTGGAISSHTAIPATNKGLQNSANNAKPYVMVFETPISISQAGDYLLKPTGGNDPYFYNGGADYANWFLQDVISITGNEVTWVQNSFPGIFDIKVSSEGTSCDRAVVYGVVDPAGHGCISTKVIEEKGEDNIDISPNPNKGIFTVSFKADESVELSIIDVSGQKVYSTLVAEPVEAINKEINLQDLPSGMYYVKVISDNINYVKKVVIVE